MGKVILTNNSGGSSTGTNTNSNFFQLSNGWLVRRNVEATTQIPYQTAGTISKVLVRVTANTNAGDVTLRTRINGANGNIAITIAAGATGVFEDTTNVDTITPGDKLNYQSSTGGATGTMTYNMMSCVFNATNNYVSKLVVDGNAVATASTTHYWPPSGQVSGLSTTEANVQHRVKKAGTLKNLCIIASVNARVTDVICTVRINGVDTAISTTVTAGNVGFFEDTTHTASVAVDDLINIKTLTSTGTQTLTVDNICIEYQTTSHHGFINAGALGGAAELVVSANSTNYAILGGETRVYTTEAEAQQKARIPLRLSFLTIYVGVNTVSANSTFKIRINGANGNQTITIPSNTVGYFHDTTNTDQIAETDNVDYQLITGATGTSMTVRQMAIWTLDANIENTLSETQTIGESRARTKAAWRLQP